MTNIAVLGVDLGKNVCRVVGLDASGAVVMRRRMRRETLIGLAEKLPACVVGMEACRGSHHLGRVFASHGHDVRLMSPEYVRPYVKAQKNDDRDAEGIAEATTRPTMRFVELKSQDQLDMQTLHRSRDRLVSERTALINQLRAILLERGLVAPQGKWKLKQFLNVLMDEQGGASLSPRMILLVEDARAHCSRLMTILGVGQLTTLAFVAAIDDPSRIRRSRDIGAYLGLVPRRYQSGEVDYVDSISKCGDRRVRTLLYEAANVMLTRYKGQLKLKDWAFAIARRSTMRKARVARRCGGRCLTMRCGIVAVGERKDGAA